MGSHWLVFIVFGIFLFLGNGCEKKSEKNSATITDIKELVEVRCSACHFSNRIFENPQPAQRWPSIVQRMYALNPAMMSKDEADRITAYLLKNNSLPE